MIDWWPANQIRYSSPQVLFLIQNLELLGTGRYPPECRETGYSGSQSGVGHHAPFETASGIHAELTARLDNCGRDGANLIFEVQHNRNLSYESRLALRYCAGFKRKVTGYEDWKKVTKMRDNEYNFNKRRTALPQFSVTIQTTTVLFVS